MKDLQLELFKDLTRVRVPHSKVHFYHIGKCKQSNYTDDFIGISDGHFIKFIYEPSFYIDLNAAKNSINNVVANIELDMQKILDNVSSSETQETEITNEIIVDEKNPKLEMRVFHTKETNEKVYINTRFLDYFDLVGVRFISTISSHKRLSYNQPIIIMRGDIVEGYILPVNKLGNNI